MKKRNEIDNTNNKTFDNINNIDRNKKNNNIKFIRIILTISKSIIILGWEK